MSLATFEASEAFDFSKCIRNVALDKMGLEAPRLTSTGTTIVAAVVKVKAIIVFIRAQNLFLIRTR